jgi:hypothetical protein
MDPNCKPTHARIYTVPRSMEQKWQQIKETARFMDIGVLEEDYSSAWTSLFQKIAIRKKNGTIRVVTDFRLQETRLIFETLYFIHFLFQILAHDSFNGMV